MSKVKNHFGLILIFFASLLIVLPFFHPGFFPMHDDTQVARIYEMSKSLKDGNFPVRWVRDLGYGYGYPIFNYYSPLPYYIGGLLVLLGFDLLIATKIVFVLGIVLSGISMYLLMKIFFDKTSAIVSSILYVYFPYHAVNIYVRGDLDELYAYSILPFVFLGFNKIHYISKICLSFKTNLKWILLSSVSIFIIIISHNLTSFMLLFLLILFIIFSLIISHNRVKLSLFYFLSLLLGFLLSAFYSIPALFEMNYTNISSQIGGGAHYPDHFLCLYQLWDSPWGYGGSVKGCVDGMSFKLGKVNVIFVLISIIYFLYLLVNKKIKEKRFIAICSILLFFVSIFMLFPYSSSIWNNIPKMEFIQYPWRFLNFIGLFLSILVGYFVYLLSKINNKFVKFIPLIIIILTVFYNLKLFNPSVYLNRNASFYTKENYLKWEVSKISDEYMSVRIIKPKTINEIPKSVIEIVEGEGNIDKLYEKTGYVSAILNISRSSEIKVNLDHRRLWNYYINNNKIYSDSNIISLEKGNYTFEAKLYQTKIEILANYITLISICALIIGIIKSINLKL